MPPDLSSRPKITLLPVVLVKQVKKTVVENMKFFPLLGAQLTGTKCIHSVVQPPQHSRTSSCESDTLPSKPSSQPLPPAHSTHYLLSVPADLTTPGTAYQWNQTAFALRGWLISLRTASSGFIHVALWMCHILLTHSPSMDSWAASHSDIVNSDAVNLGCQYPATRDTLKRRSVMLKFTRVNCFLDMDANGR